MIDFKSIEKKWQERWEKSKIFRSIEKGKKFYNLEMYPYPSSSGLHMGHSRNYAIGDCNARYQRMKGFSVLYPMGYDSFGLPAENAAIKAKSHPKIFTERAIENFIKQQKSLGLSYDWERKITSHDINYYQWNQWIFLKFLEKGLAYRKKAPVNYCDHCKTVLANEQVHNGRCWRCNNEVIIKPLEQWFLKITNYAQELLDNIPKLDWPEKIKIMQTNWLGRSEGTLVNFRIEKSDEVIPIFTTRPDTLYGVTFMVYAPEHPKVLELVSGTNKEKEVEKFINKVVIQDKFSRTAEETEKEGLFIGKYAINPVNNEKIPIYIGNFVLLEYGTGAIMAVPAHDQRDFEFAKKYNIPIKVVIQPERFKLDPKKMTRAFVEEGTLVNSDKFNGKNNLVAIDSITKYLEKEKIGKKTVQFKIRDWLISRQRYWGTPIPIIYCDKCNIVPVPEQDLPVELPEDVDFTGKGNPLSTNKKFLNTKCHKCNGKAKRETDTMDTFFDSSWYYLRFCSPHSNKEPFDKEKVKSWMPVDQYIGGAEHAVMHLIYARFFTKVLRDLGLLEIDEPFTKLFNQGMITKDGHVMSKSRGNTVDPMETIDKYSADTLRLFLLFVSSPDKDMEWSEREIEGSFRFLNKVYSLTEKKQTENTKQLLNKIHRTIMEVTQDLDNFKYNSSIIKIMEYVNYLHSQEKISKESLEILSKLISPFCPHIAEEIYEKLGNEEFVSTSKWPVFNKTHINDEIEFSEQLLENTKKDIEYVSKLINKKGKVTLFVAEKWKYNFFKSLKKELEKERDLKKIFEKLKDPKHNNEIIKLIQASLKDHTKIPNIILDQDREFNILKEAGYKVIRAE
ncbi:MAG: leucine--tRNA ligase, partial [Nanoarchaeota archaeon]